MRVLIVEDDRKLAGLLQRSLTRDAVTTDANLPVTSPPSVSPIVTPQGPGLTGKLVFVDPHQGQRRAPTRRGAIRRGAMDLDRAYSRIPTERQQPHGGSPGSPWRPQRPRSWLSIRRAS